MTVWDELADEFRALGGTLENVHLEQGPLGRGLFAIDPNRPIRVHVPESLLIDASDIVFESGTLKVAPGAPAGPRERQFYEDYYDQLSWGGGGRSEVERILEQAQELPAELRRSLSTDYACGSWFEDPTSELVQSQFIRSRHMAHGDRTVMMPYVELANFGLERQYLQESGIAIEGPAEGEVCVQYALCDPFNLFRAWGFSRELGVAYSIPLGGILIDKTPLQIECEPTDFGAKDRPGYPKLTVGAGVLKLSFCMLGNAHFPRYCRGNFRQVLRKAGFRDVDEPFDKLRRANQMCFLSLLADLESLGGPMVQSLRQMARFQLQALTHCYGARETPLEAQVPRI